MDKADPTALKRDLESYISIRFVTIQQKPAFCLDSSWPGNGPIKELAENAFPLFIFASTTCNFVGEGTGNPRKRLGDLFRYYKSQNFLSQLDQTYWPILSQFDDDQETLDTFHKVVGSLIVLPAPLTVKTLAVIINEDEGAINPILQFLHSVFFIPSTADEKFKCGICLSETIS